MNEREREKFYSSSGGDWGDDDVEYEVEPPDADVLALEQRRAEKMVKDAEMSVDVDEYYRAIQSPPDPALPFKWPDSFRFQFQVKHLLIATAVLAVILTMWRLHALANVAGMLVLTALGGALAYAELKEQKRCMEAERLSREKNERRREYLERRSLAYRSKADGPSTIYDDVPFHGDAPPATNPLAEKPFRIQFSLRWLLVAMTIAAFSLGFVKIVGSSSIAAMFLGMIAFAGLVLYAFGVRPPQFVVLGWWLVLVLYILMGVATEIQNAF